MWHAIGILLIGAQDPGVVATDEYRPGGAALEPQSEQLGGPAYGPPAGPGFPPAGPGFPPTGPGFPSGLMPGEQPIHAAEAAAAGYDPGYCEPGNSFARPCSFDSYWDFTGQRSPTDYAGRFGYGPDWCHTWNARVEWLLWFSQPRDTPLLVQTFDGLAAGVLVNPQTIAGEDTIGGAPRNGARITLGRYLGDSNVRAEGRFWGLEDGAASFNITSEDNERLSVPLINATNGLPINYFIAFPGVFANGVATSLAKNDLFGADAWLRQTWWDDGAFRFDVLAGYQFLRMDDSLLLGTETTNVATLQRIQTQDLFITNNQFHGGSIGLVAEMRKSAVSFEVLGKLAFGNMRERVLIDGRTVTNGTLTSSGILAQPSNEGEYSFNRFTVVPELNINFVVHISPAWRVLAGYSLLYLNEAMLAGDQIDRRVNPAQPAGPALPAFLNVDTTYFVQGMNLGVDYKW